MKRLLVGVALGALLMLSVPVVADHASEPTTPIESVRLRLFQYPDGPVLKCDGTERIDWGQIRIEAYAKVSWTPSEHWRTDLDVFKGPLGAQPEWSDPRTGSRVNRLDHRWNVQWNHQNVPPHGPKATTSGWRMVPAANEYFQGDEGTWAVRLIVKGDESGVVFEERCVFERVNPG